MLANQAEMMAHEVSEGENGPTVLGEVVHLLANLCNDKVRSSCSSRTGLSLSK